VTRRTVGGSVTAVVVRLVIGARLEISLPSVTSGNLLLRLIFLAHLD
jgi:hypothetical protein